MTERDITAILSVQHALLGCVSPNLRGVTCASASDRVFMRFVFDGEIAADDREAASEAETEVLADFPDRRVKFECVRLDSPAPLNQLTLDWWAYIRRERT